MEKSKIITIAFMVIIVFIVLIVSRIKTRHHYEVSKSMRLLPFWVKYLGFGLSAASLIYHWTTISGEPVALASFWEFGFIIGLILVSLSKEKNEDEMTMSIRLNAVFISFFSGILVHLFLLLEDMLQGEEAEGYSSLYLTIYVLIMYVAIFHLSKKKMR